MARKPMVTRTITTTKVNVLCLDITTSEPFNKEVILPRTYKDDKSLMKKVQEVVDTDGVKAVHVVDKVEVETLYGMDEQTFIEKAAILDPETRKELEAGQTEETTEAAQAEETTEAGQPEESTEPVQAEKKEANKTIKGKKEVE